MGLALASDGALYIADEYCKAIRLLQNGVVSTVAGNPKGKVHTGPVDAVRFISVRDVAVDAKGRVYVLGQNHVKVLEAGVISDALISYDTLYDARRLVTTTSGLYVLTSGKLWKLEQQKLTPAVNLLGLQDPRGASVDSAGRLLIADRGAHKIFIYLP